MLIWVTSADQALLKALARARCAAERACSRLQYIGNFCRCSAGFLRFRVAAARHDEPLLRFGSDGDWHLKGCGEGTQFRVNLRRNFRVRLEELL